MFTSTNSAQQGDKRPALEPITAEGVSDADVISLTKEVMRVAGIKETDISPVDTRDEALHVLASIALVAANNPVIGVVEALGELPPLTEVVVTVGLIEAEH